MDQEHGQDEAFARLRASDPAAGAELDRDALRHEVDRRTAAPGEPGEDAVVRPLRRRPARWLQVAAAVTGVAVVGGAGFWAGRGSDPAVTAAAPAISLEQRTGANESLAADAAPGTSDLRMWSPGRVVFTAADTLGDDADSARAWGLDAQAVYSADTVSRVATALGVAGDPVQQDGSWLIGAQDGTGPSVSIYSDGTASVSYYDPSRDPWNCTATPAAESGSADDAGEMSIDPVAPCEPQDGTAPSGDDALAALRDAMTAVGVDPADFQFAEPESYDGPSTYVTAERVVDGQATGLQWSATVVADGLQSLNGQLAPLVELGEYDVIGAASGVQRMADPRFGSGYSGVMPLATADGAAVREDGVSSSAAPAEASTTPPTVQPGSPIDWPVQRVTITEARLGLSQVTQSDGSVLLAPAYEFTGDDGGTWGVIAVADSALSFD
ncbi:hypothetical protein [Cellulomonas sp. RIT-PI-Y]|uniref:hypothetical protein n=1 Tax=Cellulomonas sp. RIT-PI-Y TaxID=3035297 RepID=UPI0021DA4DEC|nr:hypothetical protein [Cellulomonas sp. RIT-PI-Y]